MRMCFTEAERCLLVGKNKTFSISQMYCNSVPGCYRTSYRPVVLNRFDLGTHIFPWSSSRDPLFTHTHNTHTRWFLWFTGTLHRRDVFILYKLYVLLPYTYPTPKLRPHRSLCISTFPPKNSLCMIYKPFELLGH